jgi:preprotein translocase subunit SecA
MFSQGVIMGLFKTFSEKEIRKAKPICDKILALEPSMQSLSDAELRAKTIEFKNRYKNGESLDSMLVEAFAVVREAAWRVLRMKHYPVQLIGGIILHKGQIAEMKTGEGKTLVSTLPVYLNAITGDGVHVVTVNDYLAKRDSEWMGKVYKFLGLSVGLIAHDMDNATKKAAYSCDITYCTNTELGFDYLRDNMVHSMAQKMQRGFAFAIVDEIDSILIDEARTPLIISGFAEKSDEGYIKADRFVRTLKGITIVDASEEAGNKLDAILEGQSLNPYDKYEDYDYVAEEKTHIATFTEKGLEKMEKYYGITSDNHDVYSQVSFFASVALKAHTLYKRDVDYVVKDGEIIIVDLGTGRLMPGRRFSNGIHQGIEAKERVSIKAESVTMASITYQNFFRKYSKLAGMTGTAMTEKDEFQQIYGLEIVEVPTNRPIQREDMADQVYATRDAKLKAIVQVIKERHDTWQPILIGTASVEKSEELHRLLIRERIHHTMLNAKNHEKESAIIAQAGRLGAVTIATNMAGRGTDIILGGNAEFMALEHFRKEGWDPALIAEMTEYSETDNEEIKNARLMFREKEEEIKNRLAPEAQRVRDLGGLFVLGTERHESRRIDNQLRGRSGRQGDVGTSVFYLSLEDDLMRLFGTDRVATIMANNLPEDMPIDARILSNAIQKAQQNIESRHFAQRKSTLAYDAVNALVRDNIYDQRDDLLIRTDFSETYDNLCKKFVDFQFFDANGCKHVPYELYLDVKAKEREFFNMISLPTFTEEELAKMSVDAVKTAFYDVIRASVDKAVSVLTPPNATEEQLQNVIAFQRSNILENIDLRWQTQMETMDEIKHGVYLNALGGVDPVKAYRDEVYNSFVEMQIAIYEGVIKNFALVLFTKHKLEQAANQVSSKLVKI